MESSGNLSYNKGVKTDKNWIIEESRFSRSELKKIEAIFAQGNGYLGQRAVLEEVYSTETRGLFLAGTFDRFGKEEVTELPNLADFCNLRIFLDDEEFCMVQGKILLYSRSLNLKDGVITRHVYWEGRSGVEAELLFERFVSLADKHVIASRVRVIPFNRNVKVRIISGINGRVTNGGTQHFHEVETRIREDRMMEYHTVTGESRIHVLQYFGHQFSLNGSPIRPRKIPLIDRRYAGMMTEVEVPIRQSLVVDKLCTVFTDRDPEACGEKAWDTSVRGSKITLEYLEKGYDFLKNRSQKAWKTFWNKNDILIRGEDDYDQLAIRFALYHLNIMADREDDTVGIGAKGLTGEDYKGHCFWDTEMCILPFYLLTDPEEAKRLLTYRGRGLQGAKIKAYHNGYKGAMFPWESARPEDGETTPERGMADPLTGERISIYTGKKELHISADISYAVWEYYKATGDEEFMKKWGDEIILATAVFWADRVEWDEEGRTCHICDVIGPDEYKQRVKDNTYTNYMVRHNLRLAVQIADKLEKENPDYLEELNNKWEIREMLPQIRRAAEGIYLPPMDKGGIIPQFSGYEKLKDLEIASYKKFGKNGEIEMLKEHTVRELNACRVHKQADLVQLLQLFPGLPEYKDEDERRKARDRNYGFYERHTIHAAPYSFAIHSMMAASLERTQEAYALFHQCCDVDLSSDGENAPEGIYAACMGGIWQCVVQGFCGVRIQSDALCINPCLPKQWESVKFRICYRACSLDIKVTKEEVTIHNRGSHPLRLIFRGEQVSLDGMTSTLLHMQTKG